MSYAAFLGWFVVLPAVALAALFRRRYRRRDLAPLLLTLTIAFATSLPWDSAAVSRGYWRFTPGQISGRHLGVLPVEECAFFALESLLVAALLLPLLGGRRS